MFNTPGFSKLYLILILTEDAVHILFHILATSYPYNSVLLPSYNLSGDS